MNRPVAILFDLDCTLTDRGASVTAFAARFSRAFGADLAAGASVDAVARALRDADGMGYRPRQTFFRQAREALPTPRRPSPETVAAFWHETFPACTRPASGLHDLIRRLRELGLRLGVVSNGDGSMQRRKLEALGLTDAFATVVISGAVGIRKPDRRIFRIALDQLSIAAADVWFVGDDPARDVAGARAAGLTPVWRRGATQWPVGLSGAEAEVDDLDDLLGLLEQT